MTKSEARNAVLSALRIQECTKEFLAEKIGLAIPTVENILNALIEEQLVNRHWNIYFIAEEKIDTLGLPKKVHSYSIDVIRILMGAIGGIAVFISAWYTALYLIDNNFLIIALLMSFIMVVFSTAAVQLIVLFFRRKAWLLALIFCLLWIVVLTFSMGSTVVGQYNKWVVTNATSDSIENVLYSNYTNTENSLQAQVVTKQDQLRTLNTLLNSIDTMEKRTTSKKDFDNWNWQVTVIERDVKALNKSLLEIAQKKEKLLQENKTMLTDVKKQGTMNAYDFMAKATGWSANLIHFIMLIFPAVFADIIAPVGIAVMLFLGKEK
jgi:hypothetical protein